MTFLDCLNGRSGREAGLPLSLLFHACPEIVAFTQIPESVLSDLANQILWQWLVVGKLKKAGISDLELFEFLAKWLQRRRCCHEVAVRLMRGESEQEARFHEEGISPFDHFLGFRRDAFEDRVQPAQMWLALAWGSSDILCGRSRTFGCHLFCLDWC